MSQQTNSESPQKGANSTSYQVIARKWRPQSFEQLVGQSHITVTLMNALRNGRLPHALLFTGPRGTGKTSSARIIAKSIRCPNAVDFVPCHVCIDCEEIARSSSPNVIEIDGASNNGVDAVRDLRDGVAYAPSTGRYKVYIIDEVHMLSTGAFNALLKTLEEPPDHVIFIMATTEVHKIPQTILSRCQRFDFRRIPTKQIAERLKLICQTDGVEADDDALWMIARQGDGSMRDSQSLLDQVITFANAGLSRERVTEILGLTDQTLLFEMLGALVRRDSMAVLNGLSQVSKSGYEPQLFVADLLQNIRHLLLAKISGEQSTELLEMPDSELRFLKDLGRSLSAEDLHLLFDMALKGAGDIARASDPMIVLEMVLLRMAAAPQIVDLQKLLSGAVAVAPAPRATTTAAPSTTPPASGASKPTTMSAPRPASTGMAKNPQEKWFELVQELKHKDALLAAKIEPVLFVEENKAQKTLQVAIPAKMSFLKEQLKDTQSRQLLQSLIDQMWGAGYVLDVRAATDNNVGKSAQAVAHEQEAQEKEKIAQSLKEHPKVKAATQAFRGQVSSIRDSK